mmetsp:Transcript_25746/g.55773  ORF Transcript_25746/g.55773 Transcript_25746/m.55773 type:complete len:330 (+) Transcript_25746:320-1309(+)
MKKASACLSIVLASSGASISAFSPSTTSSPPSKNRGGSRNPISRTSSTSLSLAFDAQTFQSAAAAVDNFYRTAPLESAFLTCGIKGSLADAIAQRLDLQQSMTPTDGNVAASAAPSQLVATKAAQSINADDTSDTSRQEVQFDPSRNLAYVIYGGMYTGIAQHYIYNELFPQIFGHDPTGLTVFSEVVANALVVGPLIGMPIAYLIKALVLQQPPPSSDGDGNSDSNSSSNPISEGLRRYTEDCCSKGLLIKYWAVWCPVQTLTFSVVPEHLRVAFMAAVSFFWFVILSTVSADGQEMSSSSELTQDADLLVEGGRHDAPYGFPQPQRP